jgi:hypothetical protein
VLVSLWGFRNGDEGVEELHDDDSPESFKSVKERFGLNLCRLGDPEI